MSQLFTTLRDAFMKVFKIEAFGAKSPKSLRLRQLKVHDIYIYMYICSIHISFWSLSCHKKISKSWRCHILFTTLAFTSPHKRQNSLSTFSITRSHKRRTQPTPQPSSRDVCLIKCQRKTEIPRRQAYDQLQKSWCNPFEGQYYRPAVAILNEVSNPH